MWTEQNGQFNKIKQASQTNQGLENKRERMNVSSLSNTKGITKYNHLSFSVRKKENVSIVII